MGNRIKSGSCRSKSDSLTPDLRNEWQEVKLGRRGSGVDAHMPLTRRGRVVFRGISRAEG